MIRINPTYFHISFLHNLRGTRIYMLHLLHSKLLHCGKDWDDKDHQLNTIKGVSNYHVAVNKYIFHTICSGSGP